MKISIRTLFLSMALVGGAMLFTSCDNDDDYKIIPATSVDQAHGNYEGVIMVNNEFQDSITVSVNSVSNTVSLSNLPVAPIVKALVGEELADSVMKTVEAPALSLNYTGTLYENIVQLQLDAQQVDFNMTVEDAEKQVTVFVNNGGEVLYDSMQKILNMGITVDSVKVDGELAENFKTIQYIFYQTKRK